MPLSEQEQRLLEEMERNLYKNDAEFVASVGRKYSGAPNYRLIVIGSLLAVVGIAVIVVGVMSLLPVLGIAGFIVLLAGALVALAAPRRGFSSASGARGSAAPSGGKRPSSEGSFMDRLNDRWDERGRDGR